MRRGEIWWTHFPHPIGSEAAYRRPAVIVQHDDANATKLSTVVVVPITSSSPSHVGKRWTVAIDARRSGLGGDSIALLYLITAIDRSQVEKIIGRMPDDLMLEIDHGLLNSLHLSD